MKLGVGRPVRTEGDQQALGLVNVTIPETGMIEFNAPKHSEEFQFRLL